MCESGRWTDGLTGRPCAAVLGLLLCLAAPSAAQNPEMEKSRKRLDEMEDHLTDARAAVLDGYGRWLRALEDIESLWALGAYRSAVEEPVEPARAIAA